MIQEFLSRFQNRNSRHSGTITVSRPNILMIAENRHKAETLNFNMSENHFFRTDAIIVKFQMIPSSSASWPR